MENLSVKKKVVTHLRILHQARTLFEKNGVTRTTIDDIAAAAAIARSTFFTHFASLDELYAELSSTEIEGLLSFFDDLKRQNLPYDLILKTWISKLIDDTAKFPRTFVELFIKGILITEKPNEKFIDIETAICGILAYASPPTPRAATVRDLYKALMGLYFGVVFCDFICDKKNGDTEPMKDTLILYIDTLNISSPEQN
jgi:AcrR family transcriptional regulator